MKGERWRDRDGESEKGREMKEREMNGREMKGREMKGREMKGRGRKWEREWDINNKHREGDIRRGREWLQANLSDNPSLHVSSVSYSDSVRFIFDSQSVTVRCQKAKRRVEEFTKNERGSERDRQGKRKREARKREKEREREKGKRFVANERGRNKEQR